MSLGDVRYTVLQTVQEVFRKLGLNAPSSLTANKLTIQMVDFINDVCNELSDFGNWMETITSVNVTAVSGQSDYSVTTSANIKNFGDIFFSNRSGSMSNVTVDQMRIMTRTTITGQPTQYSIVGTDSNGNPLFRVRPTPAASEDGQTFSLNYYIRPPLYTTADASVVIPYPARVVVLGVLAMAILNESNGAPTVQYESTYNLYILARKEALNRFKGDTGYNVAFTPSIIGRRR